MKGKCKLTPTTLNESEIDENKMSVAVCNSNLHDLQTTKFNRKYLISGKLFLQLHCEKKECRIIIFFTIND